MVVSFVGDEVVVTDRSLLLLIECCVWKCSGMSGTDNEGRLPVLVSLVYLKAYGGLW